MINSLMTEPPLDPPETAEDRRDAAELGIYKVLKKLECHVFQDDEAELELQHMALQAEEDELDLDMYGKDGSLDLESFYGV